MPYKFQDHLPPSRIHFPVHTLQQPLACCAGAAPLSRADPVRCAAAAQNIEHRQDWYLTTSSPQNRPYQLTSVADANRRAPAGQTRTRRTWRLRRQLVRVDQAGSWDECDVSPP